jgi:hypothetical protein
MPTPSLPTELLSDLFKLVTAPTDLVQLVYCCKTFADVVKPILYSHVHIVSKHQRSCLAKIKKDDSKLIKIVSIGEREGVELEPTRVGLLDGHFDGMYAPEVQTFAKECVPSLEQTCRLGGGLVRDLFEGKLFDLGGESIPLLLTARRRLKWIADDATAAQQSKL